MATQNRIYVLLPTYSIISIFMMLPAVVSAQSQANFACDLEANSALANLTFCDRTKGFEERVRDLVSRLTLKEKIGYIGNTSPNVSRLGIPNYEWWSEALHGVADVGPGSKFSDVVPKATSFPVPLLTAASFNATLFRIVAQVISTEARAMYNVGLAGLTFWSPNINILRDPRWGRSQETPGEDPLLTSIYARNFVKGLQEREDGDKSRLKVAATCKHHTAYDVDNWKGIDRYHFNAVVTKQDMADTFLPPFKSCVIDANAASLMCSYNQINGTPSCASKELLKDLVRGKWKLNGYISSDCDSLDVMFTDQNFTKTPEETAALSLQTGVDLNCGVFYANHAEAAVKRGLVSESYVDMAVSNNFATLMRLGFFDGNPSRQYYGNLGPKDVCTPEHQELARDAARQGIVLLKNTNNTLPLCPKSVKSVAVIGPNANATNMMIGNYEGRPCNLISPLQGLSDLVHTVYEPGCLNVSCINPDLEKTKEVASLTDATILIVGDDLSVDAEYLDRLDLSLPGQQSLLITAVANASRGPVILVVMSGGGMDVNFAKAHPKIAGILWVGLPGEAGGAAIADVIFGLYNPSGRLPMTWYPQWFSEKVQMTNMNMRPDIAKCHPGRTYRFYKGETVYKFGDGLSYTTFKYQLIDAPKRVALPLKAGHPCRKSSCKSIDLRVDSCKTLGFNVTLMVQNTGYKAGSHTVLLFLIPPSIYKAPQKTLIGFKKLHLRAKEKGIVKFHVDVCRHLSVADESGKRKLPLGLHILEVGNVKHPFTIEV